MTLVCKNIGIKKPEFVTKTQLFCIFQYLMTGDVHAEFILKTLDKKPWLFVQPLSLSIKMKFIKILFILSLYLCNKYLKDIKKMRK